MNFSINPVTFASMQIDTPANQAVFLGQLSMFLQQVMQGLTNAQTLATTFNGNAQLQASAFASTIQDLGTITTDQTVDTKGSGFIHIRLSSAVTQTRILTLNNLAQGAIAMVNVDATANTLTLKIAATDPTSHTYTALAINTSTLAGIDLVGTGVNFVGGAGLAGEGLLYGMTGFVGTSATPRLNMLYAD